MDIFLVSQILDYLPYSKQVFINKEQNLKAIKGFENAKSVIVRAIVYNRNRMNMIIEMEDEENLSLEMLRAHYILHYPDNYRWDYYLRAINWKLHCDKNNLYLRDFSKISNYSTKYMFRTIIMELNMEDMFILGW